MKPDIIEATHSEHELQATCIKWFVSEHPELLIFAIPNGVRCNITQAYKLKREGLLKGVPDLFLPVARNGYHGIFIEMKAGNHGRVSSEQKNIMEKLTQLHYLCVVIRSFDQFQTLIKSYLQ